MNFDFRQVRLTHLAVVPDEALRTETAILVPTHGITAATVLAGLVHVAWAYLSVAVTTYNQKHAKVKRQMPI